MIGRQCKACHLLVAVRVDAAAVLVVVVVVVAVKKNKRANNGGRAGAKCVKQNTFPVRLQQTFTET